MKTKKKYEYKHNQGKNDKYISNNRNGMQIHSVILLEVLRPYSSTTRAYIY